MNTGNKTIASLICEAVTPSSKPTIINRVKDGEMVRIRAKLQDLDVENRNKRIYEAQSLIDGLKSPHIEEMIRNKGWVGEAGHPDADTIKRQMKYDNKCLSHRINSWDVAGNVISGEIEALNGGEGSYGQMFHNYVLQDMKMAFSLRAVGAVTETAQGKIVKGRIHVVTYDWVFFPSHKIAYQEEIINKLSENTSNIILGESYNKEIILSEETNHAIMSKNFKYVSEFLELEIDGISLSEDKSSILVNDTDANKILIHLDDKTQAELGNKKILSSYMNKFF